MFATNALRFTFPENGITAVDGVSIRFAAGKIHALLGENGAGKSTLARLCAGYMQPDAGEILYRGTRIRFRSVADGIAKGCVLVPQHPQLSAELAVWENLSIGFRSEPEQRYHLLFPKKAQEALQSSLARFGITLPLMQKAGTLDTAQLHWAVIAEALLKNPSVLFLDEPSASFSPQEITQLYTILRMCAHKGACIIVVTHRIQEVLNFMDTVHIMRNGKMVWNSSTTTDIKAELLLQKIFSTETSGWSGGSASSHNESTVQQFPTAPPHAAGAEKCTNSDSVWENIFPACPLQPSETQNNKAQVSCTPALDMQQKSGITVSHIAAANERGIRFSDFSITAPHGKITGVVGIKKQGLELLEYLLVHTLKPEHGTITFDGHFITDIPRERYAYIPSKRMRNGIASGYSIADNLIVRARASLCRAGVFSSHAIEAWKRSCLFDIPRSWNDSVVSLSGGMIQKLIFIRELDNPPPEFIICAEPYWGLDRKVQLALLEQLRCLARGGAAIIVLTSDADAALETCDSIHVLYRGTLTRFVERAAYNRAELIAAMMQTDNDE